MSRAIRSFASGLTGCHVPRVPLRSSTAAGHPQPRAVVSRRFVEDIDHLQEGLWLREQMIKGTSTHSSGVSPPSVNPLLSSPLFGKVGYHPRPSTLTASGDAAYG